MPIWKGSGSMAQNRPTKKARATDRLLMCHRFGLENRGASNLREGLLFTCSGDGKNFCSIFLGMHIASCLPRGDYADYAREWQ